MTRRPDLSDDERNALLYSLTAVGPSKPVGYLPLYAIEEFVPRTPETVAAAAAARGLATRLFGPAERASRVEHFTSTTVGRSLPFCKKMSMPSAPPGFRLTQTTS